MSGSERIGRKSFPLVFRIFFTDYNEGYVLEKGDRMDFLASFLTLAVICLVIVTPAVVVGNYIYQKIQDKKKGE